MRLSLASANLYGADLAGANLIAADLTGANLIETDLGWANLTKVNLQNANLEGAKLQYVNLEGANLVGVVGLNKVRFLHDVESWRGARIERKWVERLELDPEKLELEVVDDVDND